MILSVATSVVFLFLTRKGHLLPRLRKAVLWTGCRKIIRRTSCYCHRIILFIKLE